MIKIWNSYFLNSIISGLLFILESMYMGMELPSIGLKMLIFLKVV